MRGYDGRAGVVIRAGGSPALSVHDRGAGAAGKRFHVRLVGRSDGGYNVGGGDTLAGAIDDLVMRYQECIGDVEAGRAALIAAGQLARPRRRRSATLGRPRKEGGK